MITQREYVEGCLQWYKEADLQPGNPEDGTWEQCHYPIPKCLGGFEIILLLKEHHAVQGVLQSEEFNHPCIWGWEKRYISEEFLHLWKKWMQQKLALGFSIKTQSERGSAGGTRTRADNLGIFDPCNEEKSRKAQHASGTRQRDKKIGIHGLTPEERLENSKRGGRAAAEIQKTLGIGIYGMSYEQRVANADKVNEKRKKKVVLRHPDGTEEEIPSICEAARKYNLNRHQLRKILKGLTKGKSKGFTIRYAELNYQHEQLQPD
jgi:hypothetical protein